MYIWLLLYVVSKSCGAGFAHTKSFGSVLHPAFLILYRLILLYVDLWQNS